jgi:hypothetical protein
LGVAFWILVQGLGFREISKLTSTRHPRESTVSKIENEAAALSQMSLSASHASKIRNENLAAPITSVTAKDEAQAHR